MDPVIWQSSVARPSMSTSCSRVPGAVNSRWSNQRHSSSSSSSRLPRRYPSRCRSRYHRIPTRSPVAEGAPTSAQEEAMRQAKYPPGWDEERVRRVLAHYEAQSDEEAVAEDEAAYETTTHTAMNVPVELVPLVRELIAKRRAG